MRSTEHIRCSYGIPIGVSCGLVWPPAWSLGKKPKIPRENPDFGTPPLENRSVSISD